MQASIIKIDILSKQFITFPNNNIIQKERKKKLNTIHMQKNPMAVREGSIQCTHCNRQFQAKLLYCIDTLNWPEGRTLLDEEKFFKNSCPYCHTYAELAYPSRYIDRELGISAAMIPGIEKQDINALLSQMNSLLPTRQPQADGMAHSKMEHRIVGNFYALAEQMRAHQYGLNDKALQLLKPFIIGQLQSQGMEVWNGFFTKLIHTVGNKRVDDTIYISFDEDDESIYTEDIYQFNIHLTNGEILCRGINETAYQLCMRILEKEDSPDDDGLFHFYDLGWAIKLHNSITQ